jgi:hypothetical protein
MSKQTAVEFAFQKLAKQGLLLTDDYNSLVVYLEAKAMFEEQIEDAYWLGGQDVPYSAKQCEQYYNETYGGNK